MNDTVRRETVKKALMQRAAIECSNRGFSKDDRLALAELMFDRPGIESFRELSEQQLKFFVSTLKATDWVIEILRQNYQKRQP